MLEIVPGAKLVLPYIPARRREPLKEASSQRARAVFLACDAASFVADEICDCQESLLELDEIFHLD